MNLKIAAICDNDLCGKILKETGEKLGITIKYEVQDSKGIIGKLSISEIQSSNIILFVTERNIEEIDDIERFIDCEYYEVLPEFVIKNAQNVISEITMDLN